MVVFYCSVKITSKLKPVQQIFVLLLLRASYLWLNCDCIPGFPTGFSPRFTEVIFGKCVLSVGQLITQELTSSIFLILEIGSHYVNEADLELLILQSLPRKYWD